MVSRSRLASLRAWVLETQLREYLLWSALTAPFASITTIILGVLYLISGEARELPEILGYLLSGPFWLILDVLSVFLDLFPRTWGIADAVSLPVFLGLVIPTVTFIWIGLLPAVTLMAHTAWARAMRRRERVTDGDERSRRLARSAMTLLGICALLNAAVVGYAAGMLRPAFLGPRTDMFDWRFAFGWFFGVGVPYAFSPIVLMLLRRATLRHIGQRLIEFHGWLLADSWRTYLLFSAGVALLPSFVYVLTGERPTERHSVVSVSYVTVLASPMEVFWSVLSQDIDLPRLFRSFSYLNKEFANLALLGFIGPAFTLAWLILIPTGMRTGVSIWRWTTGQHQIRQLDRDHSFGIGVPNWLVASALMNSILLGVAALHAQPLMVRCETFHCIDKWLEFAPLMLAFGVPYAFAPLILMAARRMIACIRED